MWRTRGAQGRSIDGGVNYPHVLHIALVPCDDSIWHPAENRRWQCGGAETHTFLFPLRILKLESPSFQHSSVAQWIRGGFLGGCLHSCVRVVRVAVMPNHARFQDCCCIWCSGLYLSGDFLCGCVR